MKKILATVLLSGLFLATTSPVFAVETITQETNQGTTELLSTVDANYVVTIPSELSINLMDGELVSATDVVTLNSLTAAGSILVTPAVNNMTKVDGTNAANETLPITLTNGAETPEVLPTFTLSPEQSQDIRVETNKTSTDIIAGTYEGSIIFSLTYIPAEAPAE